jgi:transcriptional regulator of arginine metabolism
MHKDPQPLYKHPDGPTPDVAPEAVQAAGAEPLERSVMKSQRQGAIVEIVEREPIYNQELLRRRLRARGFDVTQATLSRDIKELGLVKRAADGSYQRPAVANATRTAEAAEAALRRMAREFLRSFEQVQQLVLLKTDAGQANVLAITLDRANLAEVAGTIAGDDTILVVTRDPRQAAVFVKHLEDWTGLHRH